MLAQTARLLTEYAVDGHSTLKLPFANKRGKVAVSYTREVACQRMTARKWVDEGGQVQFDECCDEVGIDPQIARKNLGQFVKKCRAQRVRTRRFVSPLRAARIMGVHQP
jgi:hypothetical protein